jgi:hypothetical protein
VHDRNARGNIRVVTRLAAWLAVVLLASPPAAAEGLSKADMIAYLTQAVCLDGAGHPTSLLPIDPACTSRRPQTTDDIAPYRKHDWPDRTDPRRPVLGYQASDSVLDLHAPAPLIVQTFDFGDTHRVFGQFDGGEGDGGQVLLLVDYWATIAMTEDGGDGVQWFVAEACRSDPDSDRRFLGWLAFGDDADAETWRDAVTYLNKARTPQGCPVRFNQAYTRYQTRRLSIPIRRAGTGDATTEANYPADVVISEHYGGRSIETADHLERFYFAGGLGLIRWERWANPARSRQSGIGQAAAALARSGRCPALGLHEIADRAWDMVDCRMWTNFVGGDGHWSVHDFQWKALDALAGKGLPR